MANLDRVQYVLENIRLHISKSVGILTLAVHAHRHVPSLSFLIFDQTGVAYYFGALSAFLWINGYGEADQASHQLRHLLVVEIKVRGGSRALQSVCVVVNFRLFRG